MNALNVNTANIEYPQKNSVLYPIITNGLNTNIYKYKESNNINSPESQMSAMILGQLHIKKHHKNGDLFIFPSNDLGDKYYIFINGELFYMSNNFNPFESLSINDFSLYEWIKYQTTPFYIKLDINTSNILNQKISCIKGMDNELFYFIKTRLNDKNPNIFIGTLDATSEKDFVSKLKEVCLYSKTKSFLVYDISALHISHFLNAKMTELEIPSLILI